ncbi:MAG TPA: hypothetical protein VGH83_09685 [Candidatus Acidoferrum sp.]|jgi:hypothetical protein
MSKAGDLLVLWMLAAGSLAAAHAQGNPSTLNDATQLKTLVVAAESHSDSVIAVPPATSVTFSLSARKNAPAGQQADLRGWIDKETALNGLQAADLHPWHVVVTYDQFDEEGDNVHSGTYEEYWAGPQKFKRIYKSDDFNQTDYATDKGLFRLGDQKWPNRAQVQVRAEVLDPFFYAATLQDVHTNNVERSFSGHQLQCMAMEDNAVSDPTQYCFEPDSSILRYSRGFGWFQTAYNRIISFQGRNLARQVDVTDGGKPYLKLTVTTIESIPQTNDSDFLPPPAAIPIGDRVSGVQQMSVKTVSPQWPASLRTQHFTVTVEIVVGKNGRVISAHGISGPSEAYKGCENAVKKWVFSPYLVLNRPVEVEQKVSCSNN